MSFFVCANGVSLQQNLQRHGTSINFRRGSCSSRWFGLHLGSGKSWQYELNMENLLDEQQGNLDKYVKPDMYANFLQSEQGASTLEAVRRQLQKQAETIRGGVSSTGATPEAQIAATSASSDQYADIVNRLYGQGTQYRQQARSQNLQGAQNLLQNRMGYQGNLLNMGAQRAQNWSQVGSNLAQVGAGISTALFSGDNLS